MLNSLIPEIWARELEYHLTGHYPPWYVPPSPEETWRRHIHWRRLQNLRYWRERPRKNVLRFADLMEVA